MGDRNPAFGAFPSSRNGDRGKLQVVGMNACIAAMCPCGNRVPLMIPVIPGARASAMCGECGTSFRAESITYYEPKIALDSEGNQDPAKTKPPQVSVSFDGQAPL